MTYAETLDFLEVLVKAYVECDASEDPDADDQDGDPEVEDVEEGVSSAGDVDDLNWNQSCRGRINFQNHFLGMSLFGVEAQLVTESLKLLVEFHESRQSRCPSGDRDRGCLSDFNRDFPFGAGELLDEV